ncbi:hypothetical protein H8B06_05970 [Sphingobacterium sp. DN00404]|uniref:Uncharacterized protein n=1 Tax=Sphingobacterium micropteri TaxID=2763501 RepID=A0ABR7YM75_9SPHI|nr:hypothetical protein [Sphingobacterium micropteri]MBD1432364.1 hypothetical protein [Sphingobacterium micropteri]
MINLYWPVYKNLEKEVIDLSNQIHFDDKQLSIYSVKISELLIRCSVEIEAISKDLFIKLGGIEPSDRDLYFDTDCLQLLEDSWLLSKKKLIVSASNFYFQNDENNILAPLLKANKRGSSSCDWKKAYQAVKHNRTLNLHKGNIKNLLRALGALFILNLYFKDEILSFEKDSKAVNFPINMGSDIFAIKLHKWFSYDGDHNYGKKEDFDECIYLTKYTEDSLQKNRQAVQEMSNKQRELFLKHPKFLEYVKTNDINDYKGQNLMWDVLGQEDYINIIRIAGQKQIEAFKTTEFEAIINKNSV